MGWGQGYFPSGGGKAWLSVASPASAPLRPIDLTSRGSVDSVHIVAWMGGKMPRHVADKMLRHCKSSLEAGLIARDLRAWLLKDNSLSAVFAGVRLLPVVPPTNVYCFFTPHTDSLA